MIDKNPNIFFHPTTTIFLDDNQQFLDNVFLNLDDHYPYHFVTNPNDALNLANASPVKTRQEYFDHMPSDTPIRDALFSNNALLNNRRYEDISVFFADYSMPRMDGIEVCEQITNPLIKKVLLTEVADEKTAVQALNNKSIDFYVHKSEASLLERITFVMELLQHQYFQELEGLYLFTEIQPYMNDSAFGQFFNSTCKQFDIVEYYYMDDPPGFLLISKSGEASLLLAYTEEEVEAHIDIAVVEDAPRELLNFLRAKRHIAWFCDNEDFLYTRSLSDWKRYLHPVTLITGNHNYYCSVISNVDTSKLLQGYNKILNSR